ncbi:MAG: putative sulfate exporter family transporter [Clostridium sp.]|uniref:YeiH family protein n=2 Tax=Clostridium sp. TaxID=1506 RepID=UPI002FC5C17A
MNLSKIKNEIISILPGFIVCFIISLISKFLAKFAPTLGAATIAIFLGIILGNTILTSDKLNKGTKFSEGTLLSISVVLLGGTLSIQTIMTLGFSGVLFIAIQMIITISAVIYIGRKMGFEDDFTYLMASGNGVCGSSAIASVAPAINASDKDKAISITLVNVTGTVLMLILPFIALVFFNQDLLETSALLGGTLQSVGQVVGSAKMISPEVTELATIFKIVRIIFLVFVVIYLSYLKNKSKGAEAELDIVDSEDNDLLIEDFDKKSSKPKFKLKIPWYVIGFFVLCGVYTLGIIPNSLSATFKGISSTFEVIALAAIGMRVKIRDLINQGSKFSIYAGLIGLVQTVAAVILIFIIL